MENIHHNSNTDELIYTSNTTNNKTENCTELINVAITYTVTREVNGAVFRCLSKKTSLRIQYQAESAFIRFILIEECHI